VARVLTLLVAVTMAGGLGCGVATADEAPISGTVKTVDTAANTLLLSKSAASQLLPARCTRTVRGQGRHHTPLGWVDVAMG